MSGRGGVKKGGTWRLSRVLTGDMEDLVISDIMNDVFLPQGRYPENFVLISQLEEGQEGGSRRGVLGGH